MKNLVESENQEILETIFNLLKDVAPEASSKTQVIISDLARCFVNAWRNVFGSSAKHVACCWHFEKAMDLNIKAPRLLQGIKQLRILTEVSEFELQYHKLESD